MVGGVVRLDGGADQFSLADEEAAAWGGGCTVLRVSVKFSKWLHWYTDSNYRHFATTKPRDSARQPPPSHSGAHARSHRSRCQRVARSGGE